MRTYITKKKFLPFKRTSKHKIVEDWLSFLHQEQEKYYCDTLHLKYDQCFKRKHNKPFQTVLKCKLKRLWVNKQ